MMNFNTYYKVGCIWMTLFLSPILLIGYILTAIGIGIKIMGYALRFDFRSAFDELDYSDFSIK